MKRKLNATWLKRLFNIWPPYLGAGLKVLEITEQWDFARVKLRKGRLNSNYFGTAYGGSLYSMTDPFYALLLVNQLGRDYIVWDKGATIKYVRPGTTDVYCEFKLSPEKVLEIKQLTDQQEKYEPEFEVEIFDANQQLVAKVTKILHVRRKR